MLHFVCHEVLVRKLLDGEVLLHEADRAVEAIEGEIL